MGGWDGGDWGGRREYITAATPATTATTTTTITNQMCILTHTNRADTLTINYTLSLSVSTLCSELSIEAIACERLALMDI